MKANTVFVVAKVGHGMQTKPLSPSAVSLPGSDECLCVVFQELPS